MHIGHTSNDADMSYISINMNIDLSYRMCMRYATIIPLQVVFNHSYWPRLSKSLRVSETNYRLTMQSLHLLVAGIDWANIIMYGTTAGDDILKF